METTSTLLLALSDSSEIWRASLGLDGPGASWVAGSLRDSQADKNTLNRAAAGAWGN